jgi:hypothetical protein
VVSVMDPYDGNLGFIDWNTHTLGDKKRRAVVPVELMNFESQTTQQDGRESVIRW